MRVLPVSRTLLAGLGLSALAWSHGAAAQVASPQVDGETTEDGADTIVVTGARDLIGVVQNSDSATLFGFDQSPVETPRTVTDISDELLSRYNIRSVYDFTAVAAGTSTGSFFGVPGSINIRGSVADTYYNGFQGISNSANYPTPIDASSNIEIVRGPPSPLFGAGQVGGFLNFVPKSGRGSDTRYQSDFEGRATVTLGSYDLREGTVDLAVPLTIGDMPGGLHLFGKLEDSDSFYYGMHPKSQVGQIGYSADVSGSLTLDASYQYIHSEGYLKNIGWNRLTQQLVDDQLYLSGQAMTPIVAPGADFITRDRYYQVTGGKALVFYAPAIGVPAVPNQYTMLDPATVQLVKLDPRVTFLDEASDINEATAHTGYLSLAKTFADDSRLVAEGFINTLDSRNYQSYGFATVFDARVAELRLSYKRSDTLGALELQSVLGVSYRHSRSHDLANLNDFALSEDRRDLTVGATPDDRFNNPFVVDDYAWATDLDSRIEDLAAFAIFNAKLGRASLTLGGRIDQFNVDSTNSGTERATPLVESAQAAPLSYNASLSYEILDGVNVYGTYAEAQSLQLTQGGSLNPTQLANDSFLGGSNLLEFGIKTSQLGGRLFAAIDIYDQERTFTNTPPTGIITSSGLSGRGVEAELRYLVTRNLGVTATAAVQESKVLPTAGSGQFLTYPAAATGIDPALLYGGYVFGNIAQVDASYADGYEIYSTPGFAGSLFVTWDAGGRWGLTGGATYSSETGGFLPDPVVFPDFWLAKLGGYVTFGSLRLDLNVDNLFDELYFLPNNVTDTNANVLPGVGRTFRVKATLEF